MRDLNRRRATVVDLAPGGLLDPVIRRRLRETDAVGGEGTARRVRRRVAEFKPALAGLESADQALALDAVRDWAVAGFIGDALMEMAEAADVSGPMFRRLFDAYCRLQRIKAERRGELRAALTTLPPADNPLAAFGGMR